MICFFFRARLYCCVSDLMLVLFRSFFFLGGGGQLGPRHGRRQSAQRQYSADKLRHNVFLWNLFRRLFFVGSLLVIGGLVIAAMITVVLGLNFTFSDAASLSLVNRVRFRSQQIVSDAQMILLFPNNVTVLQSTTEDLVNAGLLLSEFLANLQFGNASVGIIYPVQNANTTGEYAAIQPSETAIVGAINNISTAVFVSGATTVTADIAAATVVIMAEQAELLLHLNNLNVEFGALLSQQVSTVQTCQYVFMSVILAVLLGLGLFVYIPLERRNK